MYVTKYISKNENKNVSLNLSPLDWPRADIMLVSLSHGEKLDMSENILLGGYTEDKSQMVLVKIFGELVDSDQKVIHSGPENFKKSRQKNW